MRSFRQKMDTPTRGQKIVRAFYGLDYYPSINEVVAEKTNILRKWRKGSLDDSGHTLAARLGMDLPSAEYNSQP